MTAPDRTVLVVNSGSSSLKCQLIDPDSGASLADGTVERIGEDSALAGVTVGDREARRDGPAIADHEEALRTAFDLLDEAGASQDNDNHVSVVHRTHHSGRNF